MLLTPVPRFGATARTAVVGAAALVALTVAAKSARDALFCAYFPGTELPKVMIAGAALSALLAGVGGRATPRRGPRWRWRIDGW